MQLNRLDRKEYEIPEKKLGVFLLESLRELANDQKEGKNLDQGEVIKFINDFKERVHKHDFNYKEFVDGFWDKANDIFPKTYDHENQDELKNPKVVIKVGKTFTKKDLYNGKDEEKYKKILGAIESSLPKNYFRGNLDAQEILESFQRILNQTKTGWNDINSIHDEIDNLDNKVDSLYERLKGKSVSVLKRYLDVWNREYQKLLMEYDYNDLDRRKLKSYTEGIRILKEEIKKKKAYSVKYQQKNISNVVEEVVVNPAKEFMQVDKNSMAKVQVRSRIEEAAHQERKITNPKWMGNEKIGVRKGRRKFLEGVENIKRDLNRTYGINSLTGL